MSGIDDISAPVGLGKGGVPRRASVEVVAVERPAAPDRLCAVKWCLAEAAPAATVCAIHRKHPDFKPEELDVKEGHFEVEAAWLVKPCADCDGGGRCYHGGTCDHCNAEIEERHQCGFCEGDGKRESCSICGHQVGVSFAMTDKAEHETKCWVPAVKPQAVAS